MSPTELRSLLRKACAAAGSQRSWAHAHGVSTAYVSDVLAGRREPGPTILEALGVTRSVSYARRAANS